MLRSPSILRSLAANRLGNVAVTVALLALPLAGAVGFGLDYANAMRMRTNLQDSVDAVTLASVREFDTKSDAQIRDFVRRSIRKNMFSESAIKDITVDIDRDARKISTTALVRVNTTVGAVLGQASLDVVAKTEAVGPKSEYVEVFLLLDNSASMGLAATLPAQAAMLAGVGCVFACHDPEGRPDSNLDYARKHNIKLRIDTVHQGVADLLDVIRTNDPTRTYIKVSVSYLDDDLVTEVKPTTDLSKVDKLLDQYNLGYGTKFTANMGKFTKLVGKSGSGETAKDPRKVVLMATDGVQSQRSWVLDAPDRWRVQALDPEECSKLKANGVTVAVLDTQYLPIIGDWGYDLTLGQPSKTLGILKTRRDEIQPNLRACASGTYYLSSADDAEIRRGFSDLMNRFLTNIRLTH